MAWIHLVDILPFILHGSQLLPVGFPTHQAPLKWGLLTLEKTSFQKVGKTNLLPSFLLDTFQKGGKRILRAASSGNVSVSLNFWIWTGPKVIKLFSCSLEVKQFTKFIVHHGSWSRFGSRFFFSEFRYGSVHSSALKLSVRSVITACKRNILLHSDQFRTVVQLHDYFRQVLMTVTNKTMYLVP